MPPSVVVLHGGPGAAGEVAPLAEELAQLGYGVLEPFQTADSVSGQVEELRGAIEQACQPPVSLVGWSWGAWLGCLLTARHSALVEHLILVGSGPFEASYAERISQIRLSRLSEQEHVEYQALTDGLGDPENTGRLLQLFDKMDGYLPDDTPQPHVEIDAAIHDAVWREASEMRRTGELLEIASTIRCPVTAIHGDWDPHPPEGVRQPLSSFLPDFTFTLLEKCGHKPWREVCAKDAFFRELMKAIH